MTAESIAVGTELLLGDIADTNSAELGKTLARFGVLHYWRQTVGDNAERLTSALTLALSRSDLVFTIGGLGPTTDDLTRDGIVRALGDELVYDESIERGIREKLERRGIRWADNQRRQAMRPSCASVVDNPHGTAPGLICRKDGKVVIAMPGPRTEFLPMLSGPVSEFLEPVSDGVIVSRVVRVSGMPESLVEERLSDLMSSSDPTVAPYAKSGEVHVRVRARASTESDANAKIAPVVEDVRSRLGPVVYGLDDETLESAVLALLRSRGETLAVAESCTGGGLGERITTISGSSDLFLGGVISYSNSLKESLLGVSRETLDQHGAVSEECAREMAIGIVERTGATWGVSITGIAGPDGGTDEKPVGLVYVGVHGPGGTTVDRHQFPGGREGVRERSEKAALLQLRKRLTSAAR